MSIFDYFLYLGWGKGTVSDVVDIQLSKQHLLKRIIFLLWMGLWTELCPPPLPPAPAAPNSYVEVQTPTLIVFEDRALKKVSKNK